MDILLYMEFQSRSPLPQALHPEKTPVTGSMAGGAIKFMLSRRARGRCARRAGPGCRRKAWC